MLAFCRDALDHYGASLENAEKIKLDYDVPENVVVAGMGGSAIGGEVAKDLTRGSAQVPLEVSREYQLPGYAGKKTLAVLASYSGDTEETLSSLLDAVKRKCQIYCLTSGGALLKYARKLSLPHTQVKGGMPPRASLPYMLMPLLKCLEKTGVAPNVLADFFEAKKVLEKVIGENSSGKPALENPAKTIALGLVGSSPVVYGFGVYRGVALRFKQQFNENAKVPAKWEMFSELNHNETMGWEKPEDLARCYAVVFLRDESEPVEIRSRIETTMTLMQPNLPKMFAVWAQGKSSLAKVLSTILVGDFASVYLAILRGVDPTPVNTVTAMKEKIEQNGAKKKIIAELEKLSAK
jgi:glucose/mannose-6-phosphate isomerase